jgi:hypothetical protein
MVDDTGEWAGSEKVSMLVNAGNMPVPALCLNQRHVTRYSATCRGPNRRDRRPDPLPEVRPTPGDVDEVHIPQGLCTESGYLLVSHAHMNCNALVCSYSLSNKIESKTD